METQNLPCFSELLRFLSGKATCGPPFLKGTSVSPQDGVICTTCPASEKALSGGVRNSHQEQIAVVGSSPGTEGKAAPRGGGGGL